MINLRPVIYIDGILLLILSATMAVPAVTEAVQGRPGWQAFAAAAMATAFVGAAMALATQDSARSSLNTRQSFILTASAWIFLAGFSALPFLLSPLGLSVTDALFEATSGITTTGATILTGLDHLGKGLLLWRALLNWLGGLAAATMAVSLLPALRIGGMHLFRMESSDQTGEARTRVLSVVASVAVVYVVLTGLIAIAFRLAGLKGFAAVSHAMSVLSTGGFSTFDQGLGGQSIGVLWVAIVGMILGGATFTLFIAPWKHRRWAFLHDSQTNWYLTFLGFFSLLLWLWQWAVGDMEAMETLTHATFTVVSLATGTGLVSTDYQAWGGFAQVVCFVLLFIGGCTGSASGGVKILRWELLFKLSDVHLKRLLHPNAIFVIDVNRRPIPEQVLASALGFTVMYFLTFAVFALALAVAGQDLMTAFSGSASALGNGAHGLGPVIGPGGSFQSLPDSAKWILSAEMILGRLELFAVFVLLSRSFWRE